MVKVALTGGLATGKTYCLARFASLGAPVIDADRLARDAVAPGSPGLAALLARFGRGTLTPDGTLDRTRLAARVFADPGARRDLEAIIHPIVYQGIMDWSGGLEAAGEPIGIADVPLLYETGHAASFDRVVVAACPAEMQVQRLAVRNDLGEADARRRLAAQWPIDEKRRAADYVIDTSGTLADTDRQVEETMRRLRTLAGSDSKD